MSRLLVEDEQVHPEYSLTLGQLWHEKILL
jgi:hypothetical protein